MLRPAILLSSTLAAFASVHALRIISRTTLPSNAHVSSSDIISESFANSLAVAIVNPYRHATVNDTRSTIIAVPLSLSHEQILARFVTGFFAGHVFAPERGALRLLRKQLVDFKKLGELPVSTSIWSRAEFEKNTLPSAQSVLFGVFRVVDSRVSELATSSNLTTQQPPSFIDFAFGSESGPLAGVHRFSVSEAHGAVAVKGTRRVTIEFSTTRCNPPEHRLMDSSILQTLHLWYALVLFREGVVQVLKGTT